MTEKISVNFHHGLGDCANFAHQIPLYTRRGFMVEVECTADKAPLFEAAGASVTPKSGHAHGWPHAPFSGPPRHDDHYSGNKGGYNIGRHPMPNIGSCPELWDEYCAVRLDLDHLVTEEVRAKVGRLIDGLPRPLILWHPQGNTSTESKSLSHEAQAEALRGLLDLTDAGIISLDWDDRIHRVNSFRVRHLADDLEKLGTVELYQLMRRADLFIGVDSGPLHLLRFTDTPGIGCWTHHRPSSFLLPRKLTLNIVPKNQNDLTRYRRSVYNIAECPGDRLSGRFVAEQAAFLLGPRRYLADPAPDALLASLVANLRQFDSPLTSFIDRHRSFDLFLRAIADKANPTVLETGCMRAEEDWTAGMSTYLVGLFLHHHGGKLHSVDLDPANVQFARSWTAGFGQSVEVHEAHSHVYLMGYKGPPLDGVYLDSADVGTPGYQECALEEARLAVPLLSPGGVILFDDTCWGRGAFRGKGRLAVPWLLDQGFRVDYGGYQVLLSRPVKA